MMEDARAAALGGGGVGFSPLVNEPERVTQGRHAQHVMPLICEARPDLLNCCSDWNEYRSNVMQHVGVHEHVLVRVRK